MGDNSLKLLTFNAGLFRLKLFGKSLVEPAPFVEERFSHLAPALLSSGAGIIALQEVYDAAHRQKLSNELRAAYPHQAAWSEQKYGRLSSGLMLFSKYPILESTGHRFRHVPWDERLFVEKGLLTALVDAGDFGKICLANCHHTSGGAIWDPEGQLTDRARSRQYRQLFTTLKDSKHDKCIALGDFNCGPEATGKNYKQLTDENFSDAWVVCHGEKSAPTWDPKNPLNASGPHRFASAQRLDHVLLNDGILCSTKISDAKIIFDDPRVTVPGRAPVTVSDHYGLLVSLDLC